MSDESVDPKYVAANGKIICQIDGAEVHAISRHLRTNHPTWTIEAYQAAYPGAPLLSEAAKKAISAKATTASPASAEPVNNGITKRAFHEVFELGRVKAAMTPTGEPIMIDVRCNLDEESAAMVPAIDNAYVFEIELTKTALIGMQLRMAAYFWGYHGTGKTTLVEQIHARTNRPCIRIQHTINTEEADIIGQWTVRNGQTEFQLGPLPQAMLKGWTYLADEYDFAMPSVTSVYQAVLEGKSLVIKNAPPEFRVIKPHPEFRFCATGNTNGVGDESGLYQGTQLGNAANYSRFGITEEVGYMPPKTEAVVVANQAHISTDDADKLIELANGVRRQYKEGKLGCTMSPRELINAALLGRVRGGNWRKGLEQAFSNRQSRVDREVINSLAQRIFG